MIKIDEPTFHIKGLNGGYDGQKFGASYRGLTSRVRRSPCLTLTPPIVSQASEDEKRHWNRYKEVANGVLVWM